MQRGFQKQKSRAGLVRFLCFVSPTALFTSQHNLFGTMWPDGAKGLLTEQIEKASKKRP